MHVLSVARDSTLLLTRERTLQSLGLQVTSALGVKVAMGHCWDTHFDLLLIGHSIPVDERRALITAFARHSAGPIIELHLPDESYTALAKYTFDSTHSPEEFVAYIRKIVEETSSPPRAKGAASS